MGSYGLGIAAKFPDKVVIVADNFDGDHLAALGI